MRDVRAEKSNTATDTVTKLLVKLSPNHIINIGTTNERPPAMATINFTVRLSFSVILL